MRHFLKKCEEFTLCGGVGDADGLFTHGYPDNYAIYHIIIKGNAHKYQPGEGGIIRVDIRKANPVIEVSNVKLDLLSLQIE